MFWPDIHVQLMIQTFVSLSELMFLTALGLHVDSWAPLCPDKNLTDDQLDEFTV